MEMTIGKLCYQFCRSLPYNDCLNRVSVRSPLLGPIGGVVFPRSDPKNSKGHLTEGGALLKISSYKSPGMPVLGTQSPQ